MESNSIFIRIAVVLIIGGAIYRYLTNENALKWSIHGVVQKVWYDDKRHPHVVVKGREYDLSETLRDYNIEINNGDSIIKKRNDLHIKIIKRINLIVK